MADVSVRKTGSKSYPWEARCTEHREPETLLTNYGAVAFNTSGLGNRLWEMAMLAAILHLEKHHVAPTQPGA